MPVKNVSQMSGTCGSHTIKDGFCNKMHTSINGGAFGLGDGGRDGGIGEVGSGEKGEAEGGINGAADGGVNGDADGGVNGETDGGVNGEAEGGVNGEADGGS